MPYIPNAAQLMPKSSRGQGTRERETTNPSESDTIVMQEMDVETSDAREAVFTQAGSHSTIRHRIGQHHHHSATPNFSHDETSPTSKTIHRPSIDWYSNSREKIIIVILLVVILLMTIRDLYVKNDTWIPTSKKNQYKGVDFWNPGKTLEVKTLYETPFARFQIHKVKAGKNIINDWLWCDEMDHINVLVQEAKTGKFIIFRQTKYAIPGPPTLAVVGGFFEPGESGLEAAKRELLEELQMESNDWVSLGHYRAAVNRGSGHTHTFLAKNAVEVADKIIEVQGQADLERQDIVRCTEEELLQYLLDGKFGEIKWTATVALSLLKLRS